MQVTSKWENLLKAAKQLVNNCGPSCWEGCQVLQQRSIGRENPNIHKMYQALTTAIIMAEKR